MGRSKRRRTSPTPAFASFCPGLSTGGGDHLDLADGQGRFAAFVTLLSSEPNRVILVLGQIGRPADDDLLSRPGGEREGALLFGEAPCYGLLRGAVGLLIRFIGLLRLREHRGRNR